MSSPFVFVFLFIPLQTTGRHKVELLHSSGQGDVVVMLH